MYLEKMKVTQPVIKFITLNGTLKLITMIMNMMAL